jgi:hypothetical protein
VITRRTAVPRIAIGSGAEMSPSTTRLRRCAPAARHRARRAHRRARIAARECDGRAVRLPRRDDDDRQRQAVIVRPWTARSIRLKGTARDALVEHVVVEHVGAAEGEGLRFELCRRRVRCIERR